MQTQAIKAFEIVYADGAVVAGTTKEEFEQAADEGIQFVIVREADGSITINKATDTYEFNGATKQGAWTDPEIYERLKGELRDKSNLLVNREAQRRPRRQAR